MTTMRSTYRSTLVLILLALLFTACSELPAGSPPLAPELTEAAIVVSGGPMLNGWHRGERTGSGTIVWKARELLAAGDIDIDGFFELVESSTPSVGYCNTMGTATTMNSLTEALGMSLPGCAAIPAPYRERGQIAYETGKRIVDMVWEDLRPSQILTAAAFDNAIVTDMALAGSTNAIVHLLALASRAGVHQEGDRTTATSAGPRSRMLSRLKIGPATAMS